MFLQIDGRSGAARQLRRLHGYVKFGMKIIMNISVLYVRSTACRSTVVNMAVMAKLYDYIQ